MASRDTTILRRTMFLDTRNDRVRIHDFFVVQTSLGMMVEPFPMMPMLRHAGQQFQQDNALALVDDFQLLDGRQRFMVQNPENWGNPLKWACCHDLQLFQRNQTYEMFGKKHERGV